MSDEDYQEAFEGNLEFFGAVMALTANASKKSQQAARKNRQNALFKFREEVRRIELLYQTNPGQAYYDTLIALWRFNRCGFSSKEFSNLQWKEVFLETSSGLEELKNFGLLQIDDDARTAAEQLYQKDRIAIEVRLEKQLMKGRLREIFNQMFYWIAVVLIIIIVGFFLLLGLASQM